MNIRDKYSQWCKETKRNGSVLVGGSMYEFFNWLDNQENNTLAEKLFNAMGDFVCKAFPEALAKDHLKKLEKEAAEAIEDSTDIMEYVDCLLCLFGAAYKASLDYNEIIEKAFFKLEICKRRDWIKLEDGTYQHKEEL